MTLREEQSEFAQALGCLINYAYRSGYQLTLADAYATSGHRKGSYHYRRLAIDLNLFKDGVWLTDTLDHLPLGVFWEKLGGTWGGRFKRPDGNHYSWGEGRPSDLQEEGSMFQQMIVSQFVGILMQMLTTEVMKKAVDAMLDIVEEAVEKSPNTMDDALVLPICNKLRQSFDVPDND